MAVEETDLVQVAARIDKLVDRIDALLDHQGSPHTQTVHHTASGIGAWGAAAVVACFCTWFGLVLVVMDIHDLRAWIDIFRGQITTLKVQMESKP